MDEKLSSEQEQLLKDINSLILQDLSVGVGEQFPPNQGTFVVHHPQPVSPSGVMDCNTLIKHQEKYRGLESHSLPGCIEKERALGGTRLEDKPECFELELRQEKEVIDIGPGVGKKKPLHTTAPLPAEKRKKDKDMEAMHVLSPGGEDQDYFFNTKKLYFFGDQGNSSKAFTDNDWPPPVQHDESFQKTSSAVKFSYKELLSPFVGEDVQSSYNESEWQETLSINVRDQNISPQELGLRVVSHDLLEKIFGNQPSSEFTPGKVSYTKKECLLEFSSHLKPSSHTQGCVLKEELSVEEGQYSEGKQLSLVTSLYSGAYGKVDRCRDFVSGHEFIRKKIALDKFRPTEVLFPLTLKHTNVMKICGLIQRVEMDGGNVMEILMENAGISLMEFVKNLPERETLSQNLIWDLTKQVLEGLSMLHSERIIHLDIKPENLCVLEDNRGSYILTIADFGSAMKANQQVDFVGWTPEYMSPESCRYYLQHLSKNEGMFPGMYTQITGKVDVFALGLTVLFLHQKKHVLVYWATGGQNFYNGYPMEKKRQLQLQLLQYHAIQPDIASRLIPKDIERHLSKLLCSCLESDPKGRFSSQQAQQFIKEVEVKQKSMSCLDQVLKESQKTQEGRFVTHPTDNTQDVGEMKAICGGVKESTKEILRIKLTKSKKEQEVADVHTSTKIVGQNPITNPAQPPMRILSRKMGNDIESLNIAATIQPLERTAGATNQLTKAPHALYVQNGAGPNTGSQNFFPQCIQRTDMPQGGKPAKRRHEAELHLPGPSGKKMRQYKSGDSTIVGPATAIPISVRADLSKSNIMDDTKPTIVDDTQPVWENTTRSIGEDSALQEPSGNMPDFSKI